MSSYLVARLDTSNVPRAEEGKVSDDEDTFFVEDSTWATLFRLARKDCLELEEMNAQLKSQLQQLSDSSVSPSTPSANVDRHSFGNKLTLRAQGCSMNGITKEHSWAANLWLYTCLNPTRLSSISKEFILVTH
ncbi:hypothetical protein FRX31_002566 [Thalictrum thalictroides]|uniref:Uncharacterized protein n=1 Tax=Thalictrum thalictroides TaxID=46969 RepID=A0A7J6XH14_THATH|nr:hypothetical protein FRX31_002566 [Thalictrum thalictroides]